MLALAQCWNLLAGYAGLVSVGQQAFVGLGGYLLFALTIAVGLDPLLAIAAGGADRRGCSRCRPALVVFRLRGPISPSAPGWWRRCIRLVLAQLKQLGGGTGTSLPRVGHQRHVRHRLGQGDCSTCARRPRATSSPTGWRWLLAVGDACCWSMLVLRSRHGLALPPSAIRKPPPKASASTASAPSSGVYVLAAAVTGMIGALIYLQKARISPDAAFSVLDWTAYVIFIVVIGGIGTIEGPIVGVIVFYLLQHYLADFGTWYLILLGALAIVIMLFAPQGHLGFCRAALRRSAVPRPTNAGMAA